MNAQFDKSDQLKEAIQLCAIHRERMSFAFSMIEKHFPLTEEVYNHLEPVELSFFDQLIFRFSKLQDSMGENYFQLYLKI